jgi:rhamnogalacturonyl hydrolase YesR
MGLNRRSFLYGYTTLAALPAIAQAARETPPQSETQTRIRTAAAAAMAMQRRDWEQGILAQALLEANDREAVILLTKAAMVQRTPEGRFGVVVSGGPTDSSMGGEAYAHAAEWTADPLIRDAVQGLLDWTRNTAPRNATGVLYHTFRVPEMWSDGLNCAAPFLAAMGLR